MVTKKQKILFILVTAMLLSSCAAYLKQPFETKRAKIGPVTPMYSDFEELPEPKGKITTAVYKFRDQTGQYKASETGSNWSTAVTQGATTILNDVLEESGWFTPIERENMSNLLNERKIIRSSRSQYNDDTPLPPLLFAGVLLEGGIISYETNVITGGAGLRYFGAGASGQYREDRVTVYLRAVNTQNGKILKTVYTTKTILSQKVDVNLFRYVKFKRILEAETGFTFNEPTEIAVREAIEKSVYSLIIEGINDQIWATTEGDSVSHSALEKYNAEKELNENMDYLGWLSEERRDNLGITVSGGTHYYGGDYPGALLQPTIGGSIVYTPTKQIGIRAKISHGDLQTSSGFRGNYTHSQLNLEARFLPDYVFSPYAYAGGGFTFEHANTIEEIEPFRYFPLATGGIGAEYLVKNRLGIDGSVNFNYMFSDEVDGVSQGQYDDFFYGAEVGVTFYFNLKSNNANGGGSNEN